MVQYDLTLDVLSQIPQGVLGAKYGDTGRRICFRLRRGVQPYTPDPGTEAVFTGLKSDGTVLYNACTLKGRDILYEFTPQTTSCPGTVACELRLYRQGKLLTSPRFTLEVADTVYHEGDRVDSSSEATALRGLKEETQALLDSIRRSLQLGEFRGEPGYTPRIGDNGNWFLGEQDTGVPATGPRGQDGVVVGAAPAGFGLGETSGSYCADANEATAGGFYYMDASTKNTPVSVYGTMLVIPRIPGSYTAQIIYNYDGCSARRVLGSDISNEWEWDNPPMAPGVEYRTTERYREKPVYCKLVDCGSAANGKEVILSGVGHVVRYSGTMGDLSLPFATEGSAYYGKLDVTNTQISMYCGSANIGLQTFARLYYTKD